jgi:ArsR family transcriptional regulator, virulence genes transcriptional regulator
MKSMYDMELYKLKADLSKTFSDPKRLMIINELRSGEKAVGELKELLDLPQAVISHQLGILRSRGVVIPRRSGNSIFYSLADARIIEACDIVHSVLLDQLKKKREMAQHILVSKE